MIHGSLQNGTDPAIGEIRPTLRFGRCGHAHVERASLNLAITEEILRRDILNGGRLGNERRHVLFDVRHHKNLTV
jgi:hypothetical protein